MQLSTLHFPSINPPAKISISATFLRYGASSASASNLAGKRVLLQCSLTAICAGNANCIALWHSEAYRNPLWYKWAGFDWGDPLSVRPLGHRHSDKRADNAACNSPALSPGDRRLVSCISFISPSYSRLGAGSLASQHNAGRLAIGHYMNGSTSSSTPLSALLSIC